MKEFSETNRHGIHYTMTEMAPTRVNVVAGLKSMVFDASIQQMAEGWYRWLIQHHMVQDAFPFLSSDEREFLMSGILPDEWKQMFERRAD